jgi:hypothetical protein
MRRMAISKRFRLVACNIQHGGGARIPRIIEEISSYDADIFWMRLRIFVIT